MTRSAVAIVYMLLRISDLIVIRQLAFVLSFAELHITDKCIV